TDPGLLLGLLLASRVVTAVLLQVTLLAGGLDLVGDVGPAHTDEVVVLGLQAVIGILSEPCGFGHGSSFVSSCRQAGCNGASSDGCGKCPVPGLATDAAAPGRRKQPS